MVVPLTKESSRKRLTNAVYRTKSMIPRMNRLPDTCERVFRCGSLAIRLCHAKASKAMRAS